MKLSQIRQSSQKILIFEEQVTNDGYCVWLLWDADALTTHDGGCNAGFVDGHVNGVRPYDVFARSTSCNIRPQ